MLTTKLGSLNGNGFADFSIGPVPKSEATILLSFMASMLIPLKHRKKCLKLVCFLTQISTQDRILKNTEGRHYLNKKYSGWPKSEDSVLDGLSVASVVQKPQVS